MTNAITRARNAIIAIAEADATLRTLTGQLTGFVVQFRDLKTATLPAIGLFVFLNAPSGGTGRRREVHVQLAAVAEGNGAQTTAEAMTQRLREVLTTTAFIGQSCDVAVVEDADRQEAEDVAAPTVRGRADLDLVLQFNQT